MLELLEENIALNKDKLKAETATLCIDWEVVKRRGLSSEQSEAVKTVDLILAAG